MRNKLNQINSRGSDITPVTAAAAATSGLARIVRAPGPCLPSKFLLLVDTEYLPAGILSSFIARHAEQPGWRMSKPASIKTWSKPSAHICLYTSKSREQAKPRHYQLSFVLLQPRRKP